MYGVEQEAILRIAKESVSNQDIPLPAPPTKPQIMFINETAMNKRSVSKTHNIAVLTKQSIQGRFLTMQLSLVVEVP